MPSGLKLSLLAKPSVVPSGDQEGSFSSDCAEVIATGEPPSAEMKKIFQGLPGVSATKAMVFPSGDQWGRVAIMEPYVSCRRSLPSSLLRHSAPSGYVA